jgi:hypothetical protein
MTSIPARTVPESTDHRYCVLVSSCDAYADCWVPFFTLLARNWPGDAPPIYLNTETRSYENAGLPVTSLAAPQVASQPWSARLLRCLDSLPHEYVLYMQEDYFIKDVVDAGTVASLVELMEEEGISHISLDRAFGPEVGPQSSYRYLSEIPAKTEYRISAQAGLWRISSLKSYLRPHESVWEFEWYGTRRAWRRTDTFFHVDARYKDEFGRKVLPYDPTGIVHGRWMREFVEELFARNGLTVDFSTRGFKDPSAPMPKAPFLTRGRRRLRHIL